MSAKYLVLGAKGQLGQELVRQLKSADAEIIAADYEECDISDASALVALFDGLNDVDAVFNAAAFTAVDAAEEQADKAMAINGLGAGYVAAACREIDARLIHFSTDFVFGAGHCSPIEESAKPDPLSVYGATKLAGEELALQNHSATAVIRTCGLYSRWGRNFVRSIAHFAQERGEVQVVADQMISPTPVTALAKVAIALAEQALFVGGIYHGTAHGECSWYEFASAIVEHLDIDATVEATTAEEWGAPARRPEYSVLENRRLAVMGLDLFGPWREELVAFLDANRALFTDQG